MTKARNKRASRELAALGYEPFEPTDEQRNMVKVYVFNGLGESRIAQLLGITQEELIYHFAAELEYSEDQILGFSASRMLYLAGQNLDLGVSLRANQHILQARSPLWRVPKEAPDQGPAGSQRRISKMGLSEVEEELAKMEQRRRAAASAPPEEG